MQSETELTITQEALLRMKEEAGRACPKEACGLLMGTVSGGTVREFWPTGNPSAEAERFFHIDPLELYRLETEAVLQKKEILGFFHSHTKAEAVLSETDEACMIPGMIYLILSMKEQSKKPLRAYRKEQPDSRVRELKLVTGEKK